jgi:hypothetical protein
MYVPAPVTSATPSMSKAMLPKVDLVESGDGFGCISTSLCRSIISPDNMHVYLSIAGGQSLPSHGR